MPQSYKEKGKTCVNRKRGKSMLGGGLKAWGQIRIIWFVVRTIIFWLEERFGYEIHEFKSWFGTILFPTNYF